MSLSKKNSDKLNDFIKNNSLFNNYSIKNSPESKNSTNCNSPSNIFYSIIDNSENINDTVESNPILKKSEESFHSLETTETSCLNNLSMEDQLYDEFNYLLDE